MQVNDQAESWLRRVNEQLRLYDHPLLRFEAGAADDGVEVTIRLRPGLGLPPQHRYTFPLHPRDLDNPQFEWQFQRQLYDALHDYLIEMFVRTPQDRKERIHPGKPKTAGGPGRRS